MSTLETKTVLTIDALERRERQLHPVQRAWVTHNVAAVRLLPVGPDHVGGGAAASRRRIRPTRTSTARMAGNICRCGTYQRIRAAIHTAAKERA